MPPVSTAAKKPTAPKVTAKTVTGATVEAFMAVGDKAITTDMAQTLLGWEVEPADKKFADDNPAVIQNVLGKGVRLTKNMKNRPIYNTVLKTLKQEILNRRWQFNAEPIIICDDDSVANGQHTLCALVLAEEERQFGEHKDHWNKLWGGKPVTIDKMIVYGVSHEDTVINTMDTCKPRTLADVIYRSDCFKEFQGANQRRRIAKAMDFAINMLWERTGAGKSNYGMRRTHAEAVDLMERHPRLARAVAHIFKEDGENKAIGKFMGPGFASTMLYLMACGESDQAKYQAGDPPNEKLLTFDLWDKAVQFWMDLAGGAMNLAALRKCLGEVFDPAIGNGTKTEQKVLFAKAWNLYAADEEITAENLKLHYGTNKAGARVLAELPMPTFGNIDVGDTDEAEDPDEPAIDTKGLTPEEIEEKKAQIKKMNQYKASKAAERPEEDILNELRVKHKDKILFFKGIKDYFAYGEDASTIQPITSGKIKEKGGIATIAIPHKGFDFVVAELNRQKYKMMLVEPGDGELSVTPLKYQAPATSKKK